MQSCGVVTVIVRLCCCGVEIHVQPVGISPSASQAQSQSSCGVVEGVLTSLFDNFVTYCQSTTGWHISDDNALVQVMGLVTASTVVDGNLLLQRPLDASISDEKYAEISSRRKSLFLVKSPINLTLIVICRRQ